MALAARPVFCQLKSQKPAPAVQRPEPAPIQKLPTPTTTDNNGKIVLQPRLCTLRSYGGDRAGVIKTKSGSGGGGDGAADGYGEGDVSMFFATLSEYIESSKNSQDFEIISGRLAMVFLSSH